MKIISRPLSIQNLRDFDFEETKRNVSNYFLNLERLQWELAKLNIQSGLTTNYDFKAEYKKQPFIPVGKDTFGLVAKEYLEEELLSFISTYFYAMDVLTDEEQMYIEECFSNHKYEDEIVNQLGYTNCDSNEFRTLKKSAVYKFADVLNLVVDKEY